MLLMLTACEELERLIQEKRTLKECQFTIKSVENVHYNILIPDRITFDVRIGAKNPNEEYDATLGKMDYELFVNDDSLIKSSLDKKVVIPKSGSTDFLVPIDLNVMDIGLATAKVIKEGSVRYTVIGTAYIHTKIGDIKFPIKIVEGEWSAAHIHEME